MIDFAVFIAGALTVLAVLLSLWVALDWWWNSARSTTIYKRDSRSPK